jgi:hypothetical protein
MFGNDKGAVTNRGARIDDNDTSFNEFWRHAFA